MHNWHKLSKSHEKSNHLIYIDDIKQFAKMKKELHTRDDVERLHLSRQKSRRGLASIEDNVEASIQRLEDNIEKREGGLITATKNYTDNTNRMTITRK